jgi:phosphoribosyl 1,2-cyclic phosphate phosphodiesterase
LINNFKSAIVLPTMASLLILGCGTSTGVPVPACSCKVCTSPDSKNRRLRASALYRADNGVNILIDAGPDVRQQVLQHNINRIDAVLFTHHHGDHIYGLDDLRGYSLATHKAVPCYATARVQNELKDRFKHIFFPDPGYTGGSLTQIDLVEIPTPPQTIDVCGVKVEPFELQHGPVYVLGFKFGEIAYATDCNSLPSNSKKLLHGIKHLVLDGLRFESHGTHFTIPEACKESKLLQAKNTYLTHMTHTVDYAETSAALPSGVSLCFDGLEIKE